MRRHGAHNALPHNALQQDGLHKMASYDDDDDDNDDDNGDDNGDDDDNDETRETYCANRDSC